FSPAHASPAIDPLSLHDALPIFDAVPAQHRRPFPLTRAPPARAGTHEEAEHTMSTETQPGSPHSSSAATADAIAATRKNNTRGKVLTASMVGTTIGFFDFSAYATAPSLVFPALFFPNQTSTQLLSSFAIFGVAFVARPLGSIIFGHFGDRIGRKKTLIASLLIMGIGTFLIGLLP